MCNRKTTYTLAIQRNGADRHYSELDNYPTRQAAYHDIKRITADMPASERLLYDFKVHADRHCANPYCMGAK